MGLARLIYTSSATNLCGSQEIYKILAASNKLNTINGVTGILYYSKNYFMQYIEGEWLDVESTYERIEQDKRHTTLRVVVHGSIIGREFSEWSIAYMPESEILAPLNVNFTGSSAFNPEGISHELAIDLIQALKLQLPKAHYGELSN